MPSLTHLFKRKPAKEKFSVGLDIGTAQIKLVKLKLGKDTTKLCGFAIEPFQDDPTAALKKISEAEPVKKVNISVSGPSAIIRYVTLPRMTEEELRQAIKFEAEKHIPFPIAEVNTDARILKSDFPDNKMLVLVAAIKKEFLNQRMKLLEEAGIKVAAVDIDSLAVINAFHFSYPPTDENKAYVLLNIGASFSNLNILEGETPRLSRDIHIAGNNFTQKIADMLSVDFKTAEGLKINPDKERIDRINTAIDLVLSQLSSEIRTSFDYYESQSASSVSKIFLSGAGSLLARLKESLAASLGVEVDYWDPLKQINLGVEPGTLSAKDVGVKLATAIGLALRQK